MRQITTLFIITAPVLILFCDWLAYRYCGYEATITAVVRDWHAKSSWPEVIFLLGCVVLYLHLFRDWP